MKKMFNEGNQIHNFMFSSGSGTVINYGSGSDFFTSYGFGSGSTSQKVTVPTVPVPVPVPQHCFKGTVPRDFRLQVFFNESVTPSPLSIPLGPFRIFSKIREDIRSSRCTNGVVDTGGKWKKSSIT